MKIENFGSVGTTAVPLKTQSSTPTATHAVLAPVQAAPAEVVAAKGDPSGGKDWSPEKQGESITPEMMEQAVKQANRSLSGVNKQIERTVHETTHTVMYVLRDTVTKEVISEFPPKKIQDMIAKMWELAGLFVDEKA